VAELGCENCAGQRKDAENAGGARVIYYCHVPKHHICLIYGYVKSKREDLTPRQVKVLAELMKDLKDG